MKVDDYVKVVGVDGNYRYGFIADILEKDSILVIDLFDEGESKIAYDAASNALCGEESIDYVYLLTEVEKRIVPLLSAGNNTNQIAAELSISPTTVRSHLRTLRIKLHLDDRAQLIALSQGIERKLSGQNI